MLPFKLLGDAKQPRSPRTLSSLPLEFPVLRITQTIDLIKRLITTRLST